MLNGLDSSSSRFLTDLGRIQERSQRAERQISSGLRVEKASDAPEQVGEILRLRTRVDLSVQTQTNLARVEAQVNAAEATVSQAVAIAERARVLAAETASTGAPNRTTMANEARQLHERMLALTSASSEGQFVFGGDGAVSQPYVADSTAANGVKLVSGATTNSILVADDKGTTFAVSRTASQVFDAPGAANVFKALEDLTKALASDDGAQVEAAAAGIATALDHLNQQLSFYGNAQNRVTAAVNTAKKNGLALTADLSELQDTDLPTAILELNAAKLHHEVSLMAQAQVPRTSLFDFLG